MTTQKETIINVDYLTGNKIIAEFMGATIEKRGFRVDRSDEYENYHYENNPPSKEPFIRTGYLNEVSHVEVHEINWKDVVRRRTDQLEYHTSWDWLMPVVQKCNSLSSGGIMLSDNIEKQYSTVLSFIGHYKNRHQYGDEH